MAGGIVLPDDLYWSASGWAYRATLDAILKVLERDLSSSALYRELSAEDSSAQAVEYIEMTSWDEERQSVFLQAIPVAYKECQQRGPEGWRDESYFPGFLDRFEMLVDMAKNATEMNENNSGD